MLSTDHLFGKSEKCGHANTTHTHDYTDVKMLSAHKQMGADALQDIMASILVEYC